MLDEAGLFHLLVAFIECYASFCQHFQNIYMPIYEHMYSLGSCGFDQNRSNKVLFTLNYKVVNNAFGYHSTVLLLSFLYFLCLFLLPLCIQERPGYSMYIIYTQESKSEMAYKCYTLSQCKDEFSDINHLCNSRKTKKQSPRLSFMIGVFSDPGIFLSPVTRKHINHIFCNFRPSKQPLLEDMVHPEATNIVNPWSDFELE